MNDSYEKILEWERQVIKKVEQECGPLSYEDRVWCLKCASQTRPPETPEQKKRAEEAWEYFQEYSRKSAAQEEAEKKDKR